MKIGAEYAIAYLEFKSIGIGGISCKFRFSDFSFPVGASFIPNFLKGEMPSFL
jgi:hypothetical protein